MIIECENNECLYNSYGKCTANKVFIEFRECKTCYEVESDDDINWTEEAKKEYRNQVV